MKKGVKILCLLLAWIGLTACVNSSPELGPGQEVSSYEEKTIEAKFPVQLQITCDFGEFEVYSWEQKQVKFEITRRIRGNKERQILEKQLDSFKTEIVQKDNRIGFNGECSLKDANYPGYSLLVKIYLPKRMEELQCVLTKGQLRFVDDLRCSLSIKAEKADLEINHLKGRLEAQLGEGRIRFSSGELEAGSGISTGKGNIDISASCAVGGEYSLQTGGGMIRLQLPASLPAVFEYPGAEVPAAAMEEYGAAGGDGDEPVIPAKFKLRAGLGKIEIIRNNNIEGITK